VTIMNVSNARRWWALAALAISVLVVGLDLTVLNLALPTLARDLHASTGDLQWFIASYSLVVAAALLPAGLLGDRLGRKKVLLVALVVFGVGSVACAYSGSSAALIASRALLGLGAAAILPLALAVLPVLFTEEERPKAIAAVGGAIFISYPIGPVLGGWLLDRFWWGSVFLINVPVVVIAVIAVALLMPESRSSQRPRVDLLGIALSSAGLTAVTYGLIETGQDGWSSGTAVISLLSGAVILGAFVLWERRVSARTAIQPLIDLSLFASARFAWGTILSTMVSFALFGILFAMPQYFQDVRGADALGSGLRLLPMIGGMLVGLVLSGRLSSPPKGRPSQATGGTPAARADTKILAAAGFAVMAAALAVGAFTEASSGTGFAAAWFAVAGLGLGFAMPAAMNAALGALSAERSGTGSALMTAMRQVGATIGVAVLGTVLNSVYRSHLSLPQLHGAGPHGAGLPAAVAGTVRNGVGSGIEVAQRLGSAALLDSVRTAFVHGLDVMLWVCGGIALTSALLALAFLPRAPRLAPAGQTLPAADDGGCPRAASLDTGEKNQEHERHARR
jgi:MFS transporter, DHA2 family, multidrug resistance protein